MGAFLEWGISLYHLPTQRGSRQPTRSVDRLILGRDDILCRVFHGSLDTKKETQSNTKKEKDPNKGVFSFLGFGFSGEGFETEFHGCHVFSIPRFR